MRFILGILTAMLCVFGLLVFTSVELPEFSSDAPETKPEPKELAAVPQQVLDAIGERAPNPRRRQFSGFDIGIDVPEGWKTLKALDTLGVRFDGPINKAPRLPGLERARPLLTAIDRDADDQIIAALRVDMYKVDDGQPIPPIESFREALDEYVSPYRQVQSLAPASLGTLNGLHAVLVHSVKRDRWQVSNEIQFWVLQTQDGYVMVRSSHNRTDTAMGQVVRTAVASFGPG
ncbi:MAG: hypothetical protein AAF439_07550 [Pseudomonadota bacterium]